MRAYEEAIEIARSSGNPLGEGTALFALATVLERVGEAAGAAQRVLEARDPALRSGDRELQTIVLDWLADRLETEGRYFDERPLRQHIFDIESVEKGGAGYRKALYDLAENARCLGLRLEAERGFMEALRSAREGGSAGLESSAAMGLGILAAEAGETKRALELLEEASAAASRARNPRLEWFGEMLAGMTLLWVGRVEEARERLERILSHPGCDSEQSRFRTLVFLAEAERRSGRTESSFERYGEILEASARLELPEEERDALMGLAALMRERGDLDGAVETSRRAVELVESMRSWIPAVMERTHFLQNRSNTYRILAASLADRDPANLDEPFAVMERAHARTLREVLSAAPPSREHDRSRPLAEVRRHLRPDDLLVEFLLGEEESSMLAVGNEVATFHTLPPRASIEDRVEEYRRAILRPLASLDARLDPEADFRRFSASGYALFRDLLGPVEDRVKRARRLIVVADRKLHLLPFEALLQGSPEAGRPLDFLGRTNAIVYLPAASFLTDERSSGEGRVVIVSAPGARPDLDFAPLRHALEEVRNVAAAYPPSRTVVLDGDEANVRKLCEACSGPTDVLHLVAHATLDPALGPRVSLRGVEEEDGWLDLTDIPKLPFAPRLVILSACETTAGELVGGEGLLGFVREFTRAGSRQVVASLWKVDDSRTTALMGRLHQGLGDGLEPSIAIRNARRELTGQGFVHPFYWAGFPLFGNDPPRGAASSPASARTSKRLHASR